MQKEISRFIEDHFLHFNAATLLDAAKAYKQHVENGNKMMVTLGGAMSTAELGKSLAEMIRCEKVSAICCTGANLEEDIFNLLAHDHYLRIPNYRHLKPQDEKELCQAGMNRVTDTCIPEEEAMRKLERAVMEEWIDADKNNRSHPAHHFLWNVLKKGVLESEYQIDSKNSWVLAAMKKNIPIFTPGWEDSTLGNFFVSSHISGKINNITTVYSGLQVMKDLVHWYRETQQNHSIGFFQIGGGISGDFPICVVPLIIQDLKIKDTKLWGYFCQISDSTTSYGSYSGATPNEKISWGKLDINTPSFVIESDATIVVPLIFAYILDW